MNPQHLPQMGKGITVGLRRFPFPKVGQSLITDGALESGDGPRVVADSGVRNAFGHRIVSLERLRGAVLWLAVCDQHRWLSGPDCEGSCCPGCEAEQAATRARQRFLSVYDSALLAEIFRAA